MGTLQFVLGLVAGAGLTASCWHVNKFYAWLKKFEKPKSKPVLITPSPPPVFIGGVDRMTVRKANELLDVYSTGGAVTGFIITVRNGERMLVELGAVCTYSNEAFWKVMHPDPIGVMYRSMFGNVTDYLSNRESDREEPTESWHQEKFDFTKIRSVKDTIADLQELVDLTTWQQDTVSRAAVWLSGLAEVNEAWWTEFIRLVDLLTDKPDDDHTRESLIELVSRVVATPVDAH